MQMLNMKLLIIFLILVISSCSTLDRAPLPLTSIEVRREDGSAIDFYLQPSSMNNRADTLVLYLQGSDCNSVKHDAFLQDHAKSAWPSADWLLIEKRGITAELPHSSDAERPDCPGAYIQHDSPSQRVEDIQRVLEKILQKQSYRNVVVLGGSEGAVVAALYAAEAQFLSAAVLMNGGGQNFIDDVRHNIRLTVPPGNLEKELNDFNGFATQILSGEPFDLEVSNHGYRWWKEMLTIDYQTVLSAIDIPTLIIQSGRDQSVSPAAVARMIERLRADGKTHFDFVVYPDLDHGLMDSEGISMADKVIGDVNPWLKANLSK